jgi:hypothetical protein
MNVTIEFIICSSHLLVGVNSGANFFIYLLLRRNFRAATWRLLTCQAPPGDRGGGSGGIYTRSTTMRTRMSQE